MGDPPATHAGWARTGHPAGWQVQAIPEPAWSLPCAHPPMAARWRHGPQDCPRGKPAPGSAACWLRTRLPPRAWACVWERHRGRLGPSRVVLGSIGDVCPGAGGPALVFPALEFVPNLPLNTHTSFGLCAMPGGDLVPQVTGPDLRSSRMARPAAVTRQDLRALSQELVLGHVSWLQRRGQESELGQTVGAAGSRCT